MGASGARGRSDCRLELIHWRHVRQRPWLITAGVQAQLLMTHEAGCAHRFSHGSVDLANRCHDSRADHYAPRPARRHDRALWLTRLMSNSSRADVPYCQRTYVDLPRRDGS